MQPFRNNFYTNKAKCPSLQIDVSFSKKVMFSVIIIPDILKYILCYKLQIRCRCVCL